jgi:hypothetical protein
LSKNQFTGKIPTGLLCSPSLATLVVTPGNPEFTVAPVSQCPMMPIVKGYLAYLKSSKKKEKRMLTSTVLSERQAESLSVCKPVGPENSLETNIHCFLSVLFICFESKFSNLCDAAYMTALNETIYADTHKYCPQSRLNITGCLGSLKSIMSKFGPSSGQFAFDQALIEWIYPNNGQMFTQGALNQRTKYPTLN